MSTLHTVNKSPFETQSLSSCLAHALEGSAVLMLEDGVYGAMAGASNAGALSDAMTRGNVYALEADVKARGLDPQRFVDGVELVDYAGFVKLAVDHDKVQAWL